MLQFLKTWETFLMFMILHMWLITLLFLLLMNPLAPTSRGILKHRNPCSSMSEVSFSYLSSFLFLAFSIPEEESHGTVNSNNATLGGLDCLFTITKSGFRPVMAMFGGTVTPFILWPSRSEYTSTASIPWEENVVCRYFTMLLCCNSYRSSASWQLLRRCPKVQGVMEHRGHLG